MGEKKMCPRKSVALFIVWIVSFLGLNAVSAYRNIYQALHEAQQVSRIEPDGFLLLLLFLVGIYIIPMLFVVYHYAKAEQVKWLIVTAKVLLIHLIVVLALAIIILLCMVFVM